MLLDALTAILAGWALDVSGRNTDLARILWMIAVGLACLNLFKSARVRQLLPKGYPMTAFAIMIGVSALIGAIGGAVGYILIGTNNEEMP